MKNLTTPEGSKKEVKSNQKHLRCKKRGGQETKTGLAEKDVKSNGWPMPSGFDRLESFGHDELTAKTLLFSGAQGLLMLMGSKIFDKDGPGPQNIKIKNSVLRPGHFYQKF